MNTVPEVIDTKTGEVVPPTEDYKIVQIDDADSPFRYEITVSALDLVSGFKGYTKRSARSQSGKRLQELMEFTLPDGTLLIVPRKMPTVSESTYPAMTQMLSLLGIRRSWVADLDNFIPANASEPNSWDRKGWEVLNTNRNERIREELALAGDKSVVFKCNSFPIGHKDALLAISAVSPLYATVYADTLVRMASDIFSDIAQIKVRYDHQGLRSRNVGYELMNIKPEAGVDLQLGDTMGAFITLRTSDTAQGSVSLFGGVMVLACHNGMTSTKGAFCWRRKHVGNGMAIREEFEGAILDLLTQLSTVNGKVQEAMNTKVLHNKALAHLAKEHGLSKTMVERIRESWYDRLGGNRENTLWGLAQAISRVPGVHEIAETSSRKKGAERLSYGQVSELQDLAGNLLVEPRSILTEELLAPQV